MARTVEDVELSARVLTNSAPVVWLAQGTPIRIGLSRTYAWRPQKMRPSMRWKTPFKDWRMPDILYAKSNYRHNTPIFGYPGNY